MHDDIDIKSLKSFCADESNKINLNSIFSIFENKEILDSDVFYGLKINNCIHDMSLLIWCLFNKINIVLIPPNEEVQIPEFCQFVIRLDTIEISNQIRITLDQNNNFRALPNYFNDTQGYIVMYSSGSTGNRKLVVHSSESILKNGDNCARRFQLSENDKVLITVPIYHSYGFTSALLPAILADCSIQLLSNTNVIKLLDYLRKFKPSVLFLTPGICEMIMMLNISMHKPRLTISAGDRINSHLYKDYELKMGRLCNLYGSTEMGAIATSLINSKKNAQQDNALYPLDEVQVRLKEIDNEKGAIHCFSDNSFLFYVDSKGSKLNHPIEQQYGFNTKDIGINMNQQSFHILGRSDNCINRNGKLVNLEQIERNIEEGVEEINKVVVINNESQTLYGNKLLAICELRNQNNYTPEELRKLCLGFMKKPHVPDEFIMVESLFKLPNGKIDRKKIISTYN